MYGGKWNGSIAELRNECAAFNVHFLENDTFTLGNITIAGCTLWTNMYKHDPFVQMNARAFMNDYNLIRVDTAKNVQYYKLSPTDTLKRHDQSLEFLKKTANNMPVNGKMVVVTHHAPSMLSRDPRYMDDILTGCYVSDLSEFILDNPVIKLWCHGHTHTNFDYAIGETRVVCNPRGYVKYEWVKDDFTLHYLTV